MVTDSFSAVTIGFALGCVFTAVFFVMLGFMDRILPKAKSEEMPWTHLGGWPPMPKPFPPPPHPPQRTGAA